MNLQLFFAAMLVYLALNKVVPYVLTSSVGIDIVDDSVNLLKTQERTLAPAAVIAGVVAVVTNYMLSEDF
jgi:hypothetical protein